MTNFNEMTNRQINKFFRNADESNLYPILGRFNATERAIRRIREYMKNYGAIGGIEYASMLESEISYIVNRSN